MGKLTALKVKANTFKPDSIKNLRKCFRFLHEPHPQKVVFP